MILDRAAPKAAATTGTMPPLPALHGEKSNVTTDERTARFGQKPATILLTGLTGAGKTTTAYATRAAAV